MLYQRSEEGMTLVEWSRTHLHPEQGLTALGEIQQNI